MNTTVTSGKQTAKAKFNPKKYAGLLAEVLPEVIETVSQNRRMNNGSSGIASEVISGKREISKAHAKALAKRFCTSTDLFL